MSDPTQLGVMALRDALQAGEFSAAEVAEACRKRLDHHGATLNAVRHRFVEDPAATDAGGALAGVPYLTKANIAVKGQPLDCASRILEGYRSPYDATVTARLRAAGAAVLGSSNMDEFAMGSSCENSAFGPAHNPFDRTRTPGGSSGGAAAAVGASLVPFALGSDTGGSIRQPAGFCGVVGLKPTYGRVSRYGLTAFASSLDQIGPLAREVRDVAMVYQTLAGLDTHDATSVDRAVEDPFLELEEGPKGQRFGLPTHLLGEGVDAEVRADLEATVAALANAGAEIVEVELPSAEHAIATYTVIATAEASSNLARFDGVRYGHRIEQEDLIGTVRRTRTQGFGPEVKRRILLGTYVLSAGYVDRYYRRAQRVRTLLRRDHQRALERCDVLLTPTSPTAAFPLGERVTDPLQMYLSDVFTVTANLTGLPAVAVPSGATADGLPLSVQLTGRAFEEATLLRAARAVEELREVSRLRREVWRLDLDDADAPDDVSRGETDA
jgi:aspartyl-tRNA(Asn)/glutamyl-tRNA(Gln) amidotransferase subunit A